MKLKISDETVEEIFKFSRRYGVGTPAIEEFKIKVPLMSFHVAFFQPERYNPAIACYFGFADDVGFFFEDIRRAVDGQADCGQPVANDYVDACDVLKRNDDYVHRVLKYCERNIDVLTSVPPSWFPRAVAISDAVTRKNFPDLADEDLRKKQELWDSWQM